MFASVAVFSQAVTSTQQLDADCPLHNSQIVDISLIVKRLGSGTLLAV